MTHGGRGGLGSADTLNRTCRCAAVDLPALKIQLGESLRAAGAERDLLADRPHLFAASALFVAPEHVARMRAIVAAIEAVIGLESYRRHVFAWAPPIAVFDPGSPGVFLGYDFHLTAEGPRLIEINTNAGGPLLNAWLISHATACCAEADRPAESQDIAVFERTFVAMFLAEWQAQRGSGRPRSITIVDDEPQGQYLYPEFLLFQQLFARAGFETSICDPGQFSLHDATLWAEGRPVDLVYNRLTDFALAMPEHAVLREAYLTRAAVFTPHPRAHALYADKRNLAVLTDASLLRSWHVAEDVIATLLAGIPATAIVDPQRGDTLWAARRHLFFKPVAGYGSRGAYRGDKLTRRVWAEVLDGQYVAQAMVPPSERVLTVGAEAAALKADLRCYVYAGEVQLVAARLYQGQTTNFRTPGGGFAPVFYTVS